LIQESLAKLQETVKSISLKLNDQHIQMQKENQAQIEIANKLKIQKHKEKEK
jgi:hypothetical protein